MRTNPLVARASSPPDVPRWSETLRDRTEVLIRPIQPQDRDAEAAFIAGLAHQARRFRFVGQGAGPGEAPVGHLSDAGPGHDVAFVAVVKEDAHERIVGVARYGLDPDGQRCESAVNVADDWQDKGLGTILMRHLIDVARARGIRTMYAIDSAENVDMHELARHLGFRTTLVPQDPGLYMHRLELQADDTPPL